MSRHRSRVGSSQPASPFELSLEILPHDESGAVRWDEVFGAARSIRIEIGVGNSTFLIEVSRQAPDFSYIGFEYSAKRVAKFLNKVTAAGLTNIRMLRVNAALVLDRLFAGGAVDHVYLNHPDPWPKRRHAKNRFVTLPNALMLARLLGPGGGVSLRTDSPAYARQMLAVLDGVEGLVNLSGKDNFAPSPVEPFITHYEAKFIRAGCRIYYLEYVKS